MVMSMMKIDLQSRTCTEYGRDGKKTVKPTGKKKPAATGKSSKTKK